MFNIGESYFVVLGLIGSGKSSFINAISESDSCNISKSHEICTLLTQLVSFAYNNHRFYAIDTPGFDDTNNEQKVTILKGLISVYPKIKKIILVKKYTDFRLSLSMQNAIITFMKIFPLRTFWEHVIIVNSWANPHNEDFQDYMDDRKGNTFLDNILKCNNIIYFMKNNCIDIPHEIKEYFVCSKKVKKFADIKQTFEQIKNNIQNSSRMFKEVIISEIKEKSRESEKNKGFYILQRYKTIKCIDFDDVKTEIDEIIEEKEISPNDCEIVEVKEELEYKEDDQVRWFDVLSLGIARAARNTRKYYIYKRNVYKVGDKLIEGPRIFDRVEFG